MFPKSALCQGTTSVVPKRARKARGFNPCGTAIEALLSLLKHARIITVLGILYGMLAAWRRNLRINIVTHAFTDVWEGWLKFVVWGAVGR